MDTKTREKNQHPITLQTLETEKFIHDIKTDNFDYTNGDKDYGMIKPLKNNEAAEFQKKESSKY